VGCFGGKFCFPKFLELGIVVLALSIFSKRFVFLATRLALFYLEYSVFPFSNY
jgi:hypothetical protein